MNDTPRQTPAAISRKHRRGVATRLGRIEARIESLAAEVRHLGASRQPATAAKPERGRDRGGDRR